MPYRNRSADLPRIESLLARMDRTTERLRTEIALLDVRSLRMQRRIDALRANLGDDPEGMR